MENDPYGRIFFFVLMGLLALFGLFLMLGVAADAMYPGAM